MEFFLLLKISFSIDLRGGDNLIKVVVIFVWYASSTIALKIGASSIIVTSVFLLFTFILFDHSFFKNHCFTFDPRHAYIA